MTLTWSRMSLCSALLCCISHSEASTQGFMYSTDCPVESFPQPRNPATSIGSFQVPGTFLWCKGLLAGNSTGWLLIMMCFAIFQGDALLPASSSP